MLMPRSAAFALLSGGLNGRVRVRIAVRVHAVVDAAGLVRTEVPVSRLARLYRRGDDEVCGRRRILPRGFAASLPLRAASGKGEGVAILGPVEQLRIGQAGEGEQRGVKPAVGEPAARTGWVAERVIEGFSGRALGGPQGGDAEPRVPLQGRESSAKNNWMDGKPVQMESELEGGRFVYSMFVTVPSKGQMAIQLRLIGRVSPGG